jgi:hypothetical protein
VTVHLVRLSGQIAERNNKAITIRIGADADAQISAPVIGCISRRLPGLGRTRYIGANPSGESLPM